MALESNGIVMEAGPIKYWWDENWDTPEHWAYDNWREAVSARLVDENFLVYRPHHAFKGLWDERAQSVNDAGLRISDVILNLTPPGVPSLGTKGELLYRAKFGGNILPAPPVEDVERGLDNLVAKLKALNIKRPIVEQRVVSDSLVVPAASVIELTSFLDSQEDSILRVHFHDKKNRIDVIDAKSLAISALVKTIKGTNIRIDPRRLLKVEVLGDEPTLATI